MKFIHMVPDNLVFMYITGAMLSATGKHTHVLKGLCKSLRIGNITERRALQICRILYGDVKFQQVCELAEIQTERQLGKRRLLLKKRETYCDMALKCECCFNYKATMKCNKCHRVTFCYGCSGLSF